MHERYSHIGRADFQLEPRRVKQQTFHSHAHGCRCGKINVLIRTDTSDCATLSEKETQHQDVVVVVMVTTALRTQVVGLREQSQESGGSKLWLTVTWDGGVVVSCPSLQHNLETFGFRPFSLTGRRRIETDVLRNASRFGVKAHLPSICNPAGRQALCPSRTTPR